MAENKVTAYRLSKSIRCSNSTIANWREGKVLPNNEAITKVAEYFNVSVDYLLGIEKPATLEAEQPASDSYMNLVRRIMNLSPQDRERALDYLGLLESQQNAQEP